MICTIAEFESMWRERADDARKIFSALTDESLKQAAGPDERTLGRVAWHITTSIPEMMSRTGLSVEGMAEDAPVPASADAIRAAFDSAATAVLGAVNSQWNDASLRQTDDMYGEQWPRGKTLTALVLHQVHHLWKFRRGRLMPGQHGIRGLLDRR